MRAMNRVPARLAAAAFAAISLTAGTAMADTSSERPGSILIFPKVVTSATRDTVIQIANTGNLVNELRCFYLNSDGCNVRDFELTLTKQQPVHWRAASGRPIDPLDEFNSDGAGLDPGLIPPLGSDFAGALVCVETADGVPVAQNKIKGEATLQTVLGGQTNDSKYNAVAASSGSGANNGDNNLTLDGSEYSACSTVHRIDTITDEADADPVLGTDSSVVTNVTVLPCDLDFRRSTPTEVVINQNAWNEVEESISGPDRDFSCWDSFTLDTPSFASSTFNTVTLTSSSPVLMVAETFHTDSDSAPLTSSLARNVHSSSTGSATIRLSPK